VRPAPLSVAVEPVVAGVGDDEQLPDLADLGERALVIRDPAPTPVEFPVEVVEEDPPARTEQAIGE
jgi:hypothetical protein